MEAIRKQLLVWYEQMRRDLPWRQTSDPYLIWLSEVIMQQTRVDQGLPYYLKFSRNYPNVEALGLAEEQQVLKDWEGLGYYSRARNLHKAARQILSSGLMPGTYSEWLRLPGIGAYTAAAIASIAHREAVPLMDGNVARVISRLFCLYDEISSSAFRTKAMKILGELLDRDDPGTFNQALMEFGALQCVPGKPDCGACPLNLSCEALAEGKVESLPNKARNSKARLRYFNYFMPVLENQGRDFTLIGKRQAKDIWQHLYEFPLIETTEASNLGDLLPLLAQEGILFAGKPLIEGPLYNSRHILSHQVIDATFYRIRAGMGSLFASPEGYQLISLEELREYPFSRLIIRYLDHAGL